MKNIVKRSLTGSLIVASIVFCLLFNQISFFVLFLLIIITGLTEFYKLASNEKIKPQRTLGILTGALVFISMFFHAKQQLPTNLLMVAIVLSALFTFIIALYQKSKIPFTDIAYTLFGVIYIALPLSLSNYVVFNDLSPNLYNGKLMFGFFVFMWVNDTGAYLFGSNFGKRKLFERISPGKTWEGSIGGGLTTILAAWVLSLFFTELSFIQWAGMGIVTAIFGTLGDLIESMYKRSINIKDSGSILPGHGGILDRFDGVFIALPATFCYFTVLNYFIG